MTENLPQPPATIIALYPALADAEALYHDLQDAGVSQPRIHMSAHSRAEFEPHLAADLADPIWLIAVVMEDESAQVVDEQLHKHPPLLIRTVRDLELARSDADRGAIAWRHYVFESPEVTDFVGSSAGTSGVTGVIVSGVFAEGANAEGNPAADTIPEESTRPSTADEPPTTDDMEPEVSTARSRPQTIQKPK